MSFVKILLLGDKNSGKTSVFMTWINNVFPTDNKTLVDIADFKQGEYKLKNGLKFSLEIFDTSGSRTNGNSKIRQESYPFTNVVIICFDATSSGWQESINYWRNEVQSTSIKDVPIIYASNKVDLISEHLQTGTDCQHCLYQKNVIMRMKAIDFIEVSAKKYFNVDKLFRTAVEFGYKNACGFECKTLFERENGSLRSRLYSELVSKVGCFIGKL